MVLRSPSACLVALLLLLSAFAVLVHATPNAHVRSHSRHHQHRAPSASPAIAAPTHDSDPSLRIDARPVSSLSRNAPLTKATARGMSASNCTLGVDLATPSSVSSFSCMVAAGIQFAVVRVFQSNCWLDPHAVDTIRAAWQAGLSVDVYFFPSVGCTLNQTGQIDAALNHLAANNAPFNRFWIDVEAWQWDADCSVNIAWLLPLLSHAQQRLGVKRVGMYSGHNFFANDVGGMCNTTLFSQMGVQLWYARWDNNQSFYNFTSYGGWEVPFMKQYNAIGMCDVHTDSDWRGSGDCGNNLREEWEEKQAQIEQQNLRELHARKSHSQPQSSSSAHSSSALRLHEPHLHRAVPEFSPGSGNCTIGVDLATPTSIEAFKCMASQGGIQHATIRAFQSNCYLDPHAADSIKNAIAAGIAADVYIFPSVGCSLEPAAQIDMALDHLEAEGASFNTLWLDIEDWGWNPVQQCEENLAWMRPMIQRAIQRVGEQRVGIYTMQTMWGRIACATEEFSSLKLWWAHWEGGQSNGDFDSFGGWVTPFAKQYAASGIGCGVNVDSDWRATGDCGLSEKHMDSIRAREVEEETYHARVAALPSAARSIVAPPEGNCTIGVDLATPVSLSAFQCLRETRGVQFLTVRAFQSNCNIDPHTVDTIHAAWGAGLTAVDVYFFPSVGCSLSAVEQFDSTIAHLKANNASFNTMWFDVETWEWFPVDQCQENIDWFAPLYSRAMQVLGAERVGIYTLKSMWDQIMCNTTTQFSEAKLWYAQWNEEPNYDGFVPFGGWTAPSAKQFTGNDHACDINLDFDYRADGKC